MIRSRRLQAFAENAEKTARRERAIQREVDRAEKAAGKGKAKKPQAMQTGACAYPTSFPKQHLTKPGVESELAVQPMYDAPHYRGPDKLRDMVALITGGDSGIGARLPRRGAGASPWPETSRTRASAKPPSSKRSRNSASSTFWSTARLSRSTS